MTAKPTAVHPKTALRRCQDILCRVEKDPPPQAARRLAGKHGGSFAQKGKAPSRNPARILRAKREGSLPLNEEAPSLQQISHLDISPKHDIFQSVHE
jgi:hypothetical protein